MASSPKIIVLDDDPTGSQTVHSCLLLLRWDVQTLCMGLADASPLLFVLTNTRAHAAADAARITQEVCRNLKVALAHTGYPDIGSLTANAAVNVKNYLIVSRSDSTLRGHYPLETDVISAELGPFDAQFLVPAFLEGGRVTQNGTHYLQNQDQLIPVHETEFAQDPGFGYHHSYLPDYIAEKTQGRITADQVLCLKTYEQPSDYLAKLLALQNHQQGVVDAVSQTDLNCFAQAVLLASSQGKRFLFRSAASLLTAFANLPPQPIAAQEMGLTVQSPHPGIFIVGSYVQTTTVQLHALLKMDKIDGIEVDLDRLRSNEEDNVDIQSDVLSQIDTIRQRGQTPVVYTSRQILEFATFTDRLQFGSRVAELLAAIVQQLPSDLGYIVSKGGITSNILLSKGLNLSTVRLLGQILPGCNLVQTGSEHAFPSLPVVLFPGNVGQSQDLVRVYQYLSRMPSQPERTVAT